MDKRGIKSERARAVLEINQALDQIYELIGADRSHHFELTSGSAEAVAQVFYNAHFSHPKKKVRIATSPCAEAPVQLTLERIAARVEIPLDLSGQVTIEALKKVLEEGVDLISLSWANGITGVVHPIEEIAQLCLDKGVLLHIDATHALGRLFFRLSDLPIDYFTFCSPSQGTGGLLIKEGAPFKPLILGKAPPDPSMMKQLASAFQDRFSQFDPINLETARLRDLFEEQMTCGKPLFQGAQRLPHISVLAFLGVAAETLLFALEEKGLRASLGGGSFPNLSHILKQGAIDPLLCHSALSFTFSSKTTREEIEKMVALISETYLALEKTAHVLMGDER